ncbi:YisL family protein [Lysinibacillus sp. 54212]|uniref:YisL family protein n=1 Tax=Lysinibacillus sp. 54212 TaxID=3119829 RepID=UPI002FCC1BF3
MGFLTSTTHLHITTWVIAIILFFIAAVASKPNKGVHMGLRLMYILIIISGGALFMNYRDGFGMIYDIKVLFGILVIGFMEMILVRKTKGKSTTMFWVLFAIVFFVTLYLGLFNGIPMNFS